MLTKHTRNVFSSSNRFQERILFPFYAACFIALISLFYWALENNQLFSKVHKNKTLFQDQISFIKVLEMSSSVLWVILFLLLIYWAADVSNKMLGAYDRILSELDYIIINNKSSSIKARDDDEFFNELLLRINILIEKEQNRREKLITQLIEERMGKATINSKKSLKKT